MVAEVYGVVIGIEKYSITGMSPVPYGCDDAKAFAETLTKSLGVPAANIALWLNDDANRTNLEIELPRIVGRLNAKDRFYFYYAGHGLYCGGANRLTAWDTHPQHLFGTTVDLEGILLKALRASPCRSSLVFIDACADQMVEPAALSRDVTSDMDDVQFLKFVRDCRARRRIFRPARKTKSLALRQP